MTTITAAPQYLVMTAIGDNKTGLVSELTGLVYQCGCNVVDSKMAIFANEFTVIMLLEGSQQHILQFETQLPPLAMKLDMLTTLKRTHKAEAQPHQLDDLTQHFMISLEGPDKAGTIKQLTSFLASHDIDIIGLRSEISTIDAIEMQCAQIEISVPDTSQLEKITAELEKTCKLEGMLCRITPVTLKL
jgi:glycine cleavage system transcriptional repressor